MFMLHLQGKVAHVLPFVGELQQKPHVSVVEAEMEREGDQVELSLMVDHQPRKRVRILRLHTESGQVVSIPLLDMMQVEWEEGKHLFCGRSFDIFGSSGGGG
ncbi:hypothetical protein [Laceyella putida]|uniref:Uncharacterized protein n=1 Tax=Laceyella putida TaxID=110101 RepID=A0ABW2RP18_9BACL